jgi:hypothetical protein
LCIQKIKEIAMSANKSLLSYLSEAMDRYRDEQRASIPQAIVAPTARALPWLLRQLTPNLGSVLLVLILLSTFPGIAAPLGGPSAASISTMPYQGRLADASGNPITGKHNMEFRLYDSPVSATPLWEEFWTGGNSVDVSDGLFSVMLGSINADLASVVQGNNNLYLGITVGTDSEMTPRVQLGSVPFSIWSLTVADGSVTTAKIAAGAVTSGKLADNSVTSRKVQITRGEQFGSAGNTSLTTESQVLPGLSFSVNPTTNQVLIVSATLDAWKQSSSGPVIAMIYVDGVPQGRPLVLSGTDVRASISTSRQIALSAGSHTIDVRAYVESGSGSEIITENSVVTYMLLSQ